MPRCYMVKKSAARHDGPSPCSPTEATVAPPCYSPTEHSGLTEARASGAEFPEQSPSSQQAVCERSAAETEAAHELLSLAQSTPVHPTVLTVLHPPQRLLPIYSYTIQPTNIYVLAEESSPPVYQTISTITPVQTVEYTTIPSQVNYVSYETPETNDNQPETILPSHDFTTKTEIEAPVTKVINKVKVAKYDCNECGKKYATSSNLTRHKQTHQSLDSMAARHCTVCGKAYVSLPALSMHTLTHSMSHVCGICGKQFSRQWLLRGHLRLHSGEKPFRCTECGKTFADRSNLRAHLQTHSTNKKHTCRRCRKSFTLKSYLNKHLESGCARGD